MAKANLIWFILLYVKFNFILTMIIILIQLHN